MQSSLSGIMSAILDKIAHETLLHVETYPLECLAISLAMFSDPNDGIDGKALESMRATTGLS